MRFSVVDGEVSMPQGTAFFRRPSRPNHHGVDLLPMPRGSAPRIFALDDGEVINVRRHTGGVGAGNWLDIAHDNGLFTSYLHMASFAPGIAVGTRVKRGQFIGIVGNTGAEATSRGHLHFEVRRVRTRNPAQNAIDPLPFLEAYQLENEVEEVTQEQFNSMMDEYLLQRAGLPMAGNSTAEEFGEAIRAGITDGTRPQSLATRQEVAVMVKRSLNRMRIMFADASIEM